MSITVPANSSTYQMTVASIRLRTSAMRSSSLAPAYSSGTVYVVADAWAAFYGSSVAALVLAFRA